MTECAVESSAGVIVAGLNVKKSAHVLHVDDELGLLRIMKQFLEVEYRFRVDTASSVDEALEKVKKEAYDVVVSDYQMPGKDGLEFLKELRQKGFAVPFIMFTGRGREEVAIKALNLGADQYLNKSGNPETVYAELAHSIQRAAERKNALEMLKESEERYRGLVENSKDSIVIIDLKGNVLFANKATEKLTGYTDRMTHVNVRKVTPLRYWPKSLEMLRKARKGEQIPYFESMIRRKDGTLIPVESAGQAILKDGKTVGIQIVVRDISDRRQKERERKTIEDKIRESEKRLKELADSLPEIVFETDNQGTLTFVNERAFDITGYVQEDVARGLSVFEFIVPQDRDRARNAFRQLVSGKKAGFDQYTFQRKDGSIFSVLVKSDPIVAENKIVGVRGIIMDISQLKRAEAELRESLEREKLLGDIVRNASLAVGTVYPDGRLGKVNAALSRLTGYNEEELLKIDWSKQLTPPDWRDHESAKLKELHRTKKPVRYEKEYIRKDGSRVPVELFVHPKLDSKGDVEYYYAFITDTTERKKTERILRESEEKYKTLVDQSSQGIVVAQGPVPHLVFANVSMSKILGYTPEELTSLSPQQTVGLVHPDDRELFFGRFRDRLEGKPIPSSYEVQGIRKDGTTVWLELSSARIEYNGQPAVQATFFDITERKQNEKALMESEEKYRELAESISDVFFAMNKDLRYTYWNEASEKLTGISAKEAIGKTLIEVFPDVEGTNMEKFYNETTRTRQPGTFINTYSIGNKDFTFEIRAYPTQEGLSVFVKDITECKKTEEALKQSESEHRTLAENLPAIVYRVFLQENLRMQFFNDMTEPMTGYVPDELTSGEVCSIDPLILSEDREKVVATVNQAIQCNKPFEVEYRIRHKNGSTRCFHERGRPRYDIDGRPLYIDGVLFDVTERRNNEQEFMENKHKFEGSFMGNPEATVYLGPDFRILDVNPRFEKLFGYSLAEVKEKHIDDVVVQGGKEDEADMLNKKAADGYVYHDTTRTRKDGSLVPVSISAAPVVVRNRLIGYVGVYKDISRQKSAERELATLNEKLRVVGSLTRHDSRNKLAVVTGNVFLVKKRLTNDPEAVACLKEIESACQQVAAIFDFASTYEKLGSEKLVKTNVAQSFEEAFSQFPNVNGTKIVNECQGLSVLADSMLRQLFYNMIDNSLKHGEKVSQIRISYEQAEGSDLKIIYQDNGVGISPTARQNLFREGFTTGKGSGYGLYLTKKMVDVYGWVIEEKGEPGIGARFVITVPKKNPDGKETIPPHSPSSG